MEYIFLHLKVLDLMGTYISFTGIIHQTLEHMYLHIPNKSFYLDLSIFNNVNQSKVHIY